MNLFTSLVDRALGRAPVLQRRQPTIFEPAKNTVLTTDRDHALDSLREEHSYAEAESAAPGKATQVHNEIEEIEAKPQRSSSSIVKPQATDVTIVEAPPAFKPKDREQNESDDSERRSPIREESLMQEAGKTPDPEATALVAPALATIVELKPERDVVAEKPAEAKSIEEIDLQTDAADAAESSIANRVVVLRTIAQRQKPEHVDELPVLKPMAQRRPTRQESRRSLNGQSQTQLAPPIAPSPPTINVTIGRVEVRASTPVKRSESTRQGAPKLSLEDYLRGRRTGNK